MGSIPTPRTKNKIVDIIKKQTVKLQTRYPSLEVLTYEGSNSSCTIKCIACSSVWEVATWKGLYVRGNKSKCLFCTEVPEENHKTVITNLSEANKALQKKYPNLEYTVYTGTKNPCTVHSKLCGHTWDVSIAGNLLYKGNRNNCPECSERVDKPGPAKGVGSYTTESATESLLNRNILAEVLEYKDYHSAAKIKFFTCGHEVSYNKYYHILQDSGVCRTCTPINMKSSPLDLEVQASKLQTKWPDLKLIKYTKALGPCTIQHISCGHASEVSLFSNVYAKGYTCVTCHPSGSIGENQVIDYIKSIYEGPVEVHNRSVIAPLELDIYLPELNLAIEYNGDYWHSESREKRTLLEKTELVNAKNTTLIHIFEHEWLTKSSIVKSRILAKLGKCRKIPARKCTTQLIGFPREFLDANHMQGAGSTTSINIGLFYDETLVAVMTFGRSRYNKDFDWEMYRYATSLNTTIVGGAGKLLSYFTNNFKGTIVSYADRRWGSGNLYKRLGFTFLYNTEPGYYWYKSTNNILSRYKTQKHKLQVLFPELYSPEKTEKDIMTEAGYHKVNDCGNSVWGLLN